MTQVQKVETWGEKRPECKLINERMVVDFTGLKGTWNFDMAWTSKGSLQIVGAAGITVFDAVDRQLGLKLEPQKRPLPVLAIDHVEEKPINN